MSHIPEGEARKKIISQINCVTWPLRHSVALLTPAHEQQLMSSIQFALARGGTVLFVEDSNIYIYIFCRQRRDKGKKQHALSCVHVCMCVCYVCVCVLVSAMIIPLKMLKPVAVAKEDAKTRPDKTSGSLPCPRPTKLVFT